jgi:hypothetical protein
LQTTRSLPANGRVSECGDPIRPDDPFGSAIDVIGMLESAAIDRLRSYEAELSSIKANVEDAVGESTTLARRLLEATIALNNKATAVDSTHQKLDAILTSLIESHTETPKPQVSSDSAKATPPSTIRRDVDTDQLQAKINAQARQVELLEEQLKADRIAAQRKIEELDAELQRERLQHALAGDRSFGRAA